MKLLFTTSIFFIAFIISIKMNAQIDLSLYTAYNGNDLGVTYSPQKTVFKVWNPAADAIELKLYKEGDGGTPLRIVQFKKTQNHLWTATLNGNYINHFYTYQMVMKNDIKYNEVPDIYAKAVGVNGKRGMIVDLKKTNPQGWEKDKSPFKGGLNDAIIYELHVRDATIYSNATHKGKFLGLTETGLKNNQGKATGLDHIKQLGITHVQLLPCYDFFTVDETIKDNTQYNWGYDPLNYNTPEGSYSSNAYDGNVRIKEFKTLVQTMHQNGLAVIMDVVYNHTMFTEESYLNQLVPAYYYRQNEKGGFSNASACGNETASDRPMMRKFIVESVKYWVQEYHIDGFRFDLMAIHDMETMNLIAKELRKIKPNIILLGEGWTAGASPLPDEKKALKRNAYKMNNVAVFSDDIRDGIKGSVFEHKDSGFISNKHNEEMSIKFGLVGAIKHPYIDYTKVNYSKEPYCKQPYQMIAYNECHDNHTLWDRLLNSHPGDNEMTRRKRYRLAMSIILTSQGVPFIHAGQEFCRTKKGEENSYKSSDDINAMEWERLNDFDDEHQLVKDLINLRKQYKVFSLGDASKVASQVSFHKAPHGVIHMTIKNTASQKNIHVVYNATKNNFLPELPQASKLIFSTERENTAHLKQVHGLSCNIYEE